MNGQLIAELKKKLKESLPEKRYNHTIGVAYTAASLAMRYEYDVEQALIAGLLHDCAKYFDDKKMIEICRKHQLEIREVELRNPFLLHGKAGAVLALEEYGIKDSTILSAIQYHTTGKPNMSLLDKIIFTADYIEPGRKEIQDLNLVRKMAFLDLDAAVAKILKMTIEYLKKENGREMDSATEETYKFYKNFERST